MYFAFLLLLILEDEKSGSQAKIQSGQLRGILKADPFMNTGVVAKEFRTS